MRSFIALDLKEENRNLILKYASGFRDILVGKFIPASQLHSTLFFFENFSGDLNELKAYFKTVAFTPFDLEITCFDYFSFKNNPTILFIKYKAQHLLDYYKQLKDFLDKSGINYDRKPFKEHITVCRIKKVDDLDLFRRQISIANETFFPVTITVPSISFYKSKLTPDGPVYEKLFSLGGA
ncbi:RNA 2',3'-cyclic phosphodiesterase [Calditerrivibrio sp.]|uniref:RNA 2',3'-cyclic phosphodiesterase n=1 Tax=Calditerrivibrio sp. TaxID=2792612 RepID=UPI003D119BFF